MSIDALFSLLDRFGTGSLTVRTSDGFGTRPFLAIADRRREELLSVAEESWLKLYGGRELDATVSFVDEASWSHLVITARLRRSLRSEDIADSWSALAGRWFPDGPTQDGIVAIRFTPDRATLWNIADNSPHDCWHA